MKKTLLLLLFPLAVFAQQQTIEATDNLNQGRVKMNENFTELYTDKASTDYVQDNALVKGASSGFYSGQNLHRIPGLLNQSSTPVEFLNLGSVGTHAGDNINRVLLPKGFVAINWSQGFYLNWKWNNTLSRSEPYNTDYPMIGSEFGGEGFLVHYTAPGGIPATSFHEINRFGGGVEGLSGVNSLTTHVPFNQFKATIYAAWSSTTTPPAATTESWWGGTANTLNSVINPLLWLNTEESKGSGYALNELARFSSYGASTYAAANFEHSGGSYQTKTIVATNATMGRIGSNVYDGAAFQNTAALRFVTRGTMSAGNVGQSLIISTSPTNTAGLVDRVEITNDGLFKTYIPWETQGATVAIPSYSSLGLTPALSTLTAYRMQAFSTASGGFLLHGFTSTSAASANAVFIRGVQGNTSPTGANFVFAATKHNGTTNIADIGATEIGFQFRNNATNLIEILGSGRTGFGVSTPTANIHIKAGTATASTAPLKIAEGTNLTTPEDGAIEHTSDNLNFTAGTTRYTLAKTLTATATLNYDLTSVNSQDLTITVTGAADGDAVTVGVPNASATANVVYTWWVSGSNTVTVRASRIDVASGADPASGTFRASVTKY